MAYFLSKTLGVVILPGNLLLFFCLIGLALHLLKRQRIWSLAFLLTGIIGLAACAILPVGTWLMRPLEDRFSQPSPMPTKVDGIVLLGGAINLNVSADRGMPALNIRAARMVAFSALAHTYPHARLFFTGGNPNLLHDNVTEASVARKLFVELGINPARISFENKSRNTRENAVYVRRLAHPKPGQIWLLVTSAADMPRAIGCFRAMHWPVVPFPVDYHTAQHELDWLPGLVNGLQTTDWAAHEWLGLTYYWIRGWTSSLFPAPNQDKVHHFPKVPASKILVNSNTS